MLTEAQVRGAERSRHGNHVYGSFGADFACSDGQRVMTVALTEKQWAALVSVTGTKEVFAALEPALNADFTQESDRYRLRETIAAVLRPWFAARTIDEVSAELDAARVLWGRYRGMTDVLAAHRQGRHPVLADVEVPHAGPAVTARSPLRWNGTYGEPGAAPVLGQDTEQVLAEVLGLTAAELGRLRDRAVIA
jgi:2-methylfumaryl-CoA isomerase